MTPLAAGTRWWRTLLAGFLLLAASVLVEAVVLTRGAPGSMAPRADAIYAVLDGTPRWRAFQNRLLGPQIVRGLQIVSGTDRQGSLVAFFYGAIVAKALATWMFFAWLTRRPVLGALYMALGSAMTAAFMGFWLYPWDYLDALLTLALLWAILARAGWPVMATLFVIGLWNRESGLWVPLWLFVDGAGAALGGRVSPTEERPWLRAAAGAVLMAAGALAVYFTRQILFRPGLREDVLGRNASMLGNHFVLISNAREFASSLGSIGSGPEGRARLVAALVSAALVAAVMNARRLTAQGRRLLVWSGIVWLSVVTFGVLSEARVWIGVVPIILFWIAEFAGHSQRMQPQAAAS